MHSLKQMPICMNRRAQSKACPTFKIGTVNQQHAALAKAAALKNTAVTFVPPPMMCWAATLTSAKTFKFPERQPVTAYKSNPTALTPKTWVDKAGVEVSEDAAAQVISSPDTQRCLLIPAALGAVGENHLESLKSDSCSLSERAGNEGG